MHRIFGQHFQLSIVLSLLLSSISHFSLPYSSRVPPLLHPFWHFIAAFCSFAADSELLCRDNLEWVWKQMQQLFRILWKFCKATRLANEQLKLVQMHPPPPPSRSRATTKNKLKTRLFNSIWKALPITAHSHTTTQLLFFDPLSKQCAAAAAAAVAAFSLHILLSMALKSDSK